MSGKMLLAGLLLSAGLTLGGTAPTAHAAGTDDRDHQTHACVALYGDAENLIAPLDSNAGCGNSSNGGCGNNGSCKP